MNEKRNNKIIYLFGSKTRLMGKIRQLAAENSLAEQGEALDRLSQESDIVEAIVALLPESNARLRFVLGELAARLPKKVIIPPLEAIAYNLSQEELVRLSAMTLLNNALGVEVPDELYGTLQDPELLTFYSLQEAAELSHHSEQDLLDYITQLEEEPPEVSSLVLQTLPQLPEKEQILFLAFLAQSAHKPIARQAIQILGRIHEPQAWYILQATRRSFPSPQREWAERAIRKLSFSVNWPTDEMSSSPLLPARRLHAYIVPPLADGYTIAGFYYREIDSSRITQYLFAFQQGLLSHLWVNHFSLRVQIGKIGEMVPIHVREGDMFPALKVQPRWLFAWLRQGIIHQIEAGEDIPAAYRNISYFLWTYPGTNTLPPLPHLSDDSIPPASEEMMLSLFSDAALSSWFFLPANGEFGHTGELLHQLVEDEGRVERILQGVKAEELQLLQDQLEAMATWFMLNGTPKRAAEARAAARYLMEVPPARNVVIQILLLRGVRLLATIQEAKHG